MGKLTLAVVLVAGAVWAGTALAGTNSPQPARAANDEQIVKQLRAINSQLRKLTYAVGNRYGAVNSRLDGIADAIDITNTRIGTGISDSDSVLGLLKATCDAIGTPVYCH